MKMIKDITASMRDAGGQEFEYFADRIEQAVTNCNQFKMREALIAMLDEKCKQCYINDQICTQGLECHWNGKRGEICQDEAIDKAIAALSTPPRNCDLYATQLQASEAYEKYRKSAMKKRGSGIIGDVPFVKPPPMSYDEWMFATTTN